MIKKLLAGFLLLALPLDGQVIVRRTASAPTLLMEDYFTSDVTGWTKADNCDISAPSAWTVATGALAGRTGHARENSNCFGGTSSAPPPAGRLGTYFYWDDVAAQSWTDYTITAWMRNTDDDGIGLAWRYTDKDNNYRVDCDDQRNGCILIKRDGGVATELAVDSVSAQCNGAYTDDAWYEWIVTVSGDDFTVSIDGTDCFGTVTDTAHTTGTVALYSWGSNAAYTDEIKVEN
jgi:hypothetical protein